MEYLIEIILELTVGWGVEIATDPTLSKNVRIAWLIFVTFVYVVGLVVFICVAITLENIWAKLLSVGVVLFIGGMLICFWCKILKVKR